MSGIYIYKGKAEPELFKGVKAMLAFGDYDGSLGIANTKHFTLDEARKGLEQLKRWVSTGAFGCVLLSGFIKALERGNSEHIKEWLSDHSSEPDFPTLILVSDEDSAPLSSLAKVVESRVELEKILSI